MPQVISHFVAPYLIKNSETLATSVFQSEADKNFKRQKNKLFILQLNVHAFQHGKASISSRIRSKQLLRSQTVMTSNAWEVTFLYQNTCFYWIFQKNSRKNVSPVIKFDHLQNNIFSSTLISFADFGQHRDCDKHRQNQSISPSENQRISRWSFLVAFLAQLSASTLLLLMLQQRRIQTSARTSRSLTAPRTSLTSLSLSLKLPLLSRCRTPLFINLRIIL